MMKTITSTASQDLAALLQANGGANRKRRRWVIVLAVLLLAGIGVAMRGGKGTNAPGLQYVTAPAERGDLTLTVTATGNLEPTNEVTVGSELSGITLEVLVQTNDRVTKGQPLARLDTRKLSQQAASGRASLAAAKAKVAQAKATLIEKETALERSKELHRLSGGKAPSKADMDTAVATADRARADLASAEAAVDEAQAQLQATETDLEKATIMAPVDGVVLKRKLEPGQTVAASFTAPELFVIAEKLERMKLKVSVAEADIGGVKEGQTATFTVDAWPDRSYTAKVLKAAYGSTVTDNVVTYETELEVANDDLSLRPGMTATVDIRTSETYGALLVPSSALRFDPSAAGTGPKMAPVGKSFLQRIVPGPPRMPARPKADPDAAAPARSAPGEARVWVVREGKPEAVPVTAGLSNGRFTEVRGGGLQEGTPVIVRTAADSMP